MTAHHYTIGVNWNITGGTKLIHFKNKGTKLNLPKTRD